MNDLISRQAAIKAADSIIERDTSGNNDVVKAMTAWKEYIKALPSAQPDERMLHESCTDCPLYDKDRHSCPRFNKVIPVTFRELQFAQPEQRWIPCSERLPEAPGFVNCTCHSLIDNREDWVVETFYMPHPSGSPYSDWGNIPMLNDGKCEVVAWMYRNIPEPYKAESEDKE